MADNYTEFSETLDNLTPDEEKWLNEQLASDPCTGCPVFVADYEEHDPDETGYGFCVLFQCDDENCNLAIYSDGYGQVGRVAHLVQKFLKRYRPDQYWSLTFSNTCSSPRVGEFGGGAVFVTADEIRWHHTHDFIEQQRAAFAASRETTPNDRQRGD